MTLPSTYPAIRSLVGVSFVTLFFSLATVVTGQSPLPEIGNAPLPQPNTQFRLDAEALGAATEHIDTHVARGLTAAGEEANPRCSDEVFVRRIYLDAIGRIPSLEESRAFLNDTSPDKRAALIDQLLLSPGYRSHQFNWMADMLRFKSGIKRAQFSNFQRFLKDGIRTNRGWDEMVYDMLVAEGSLATNGASGYLLRDASMPLDGLANTLTVFLGANVACAQCHDHPLAEWTQWEFYEMASFFATADVSYRDPRKVGNKVKDGTISKQDGIVAVAPNLYRVHNLDEFTLEIPEDYAYDDIDPGTVVEPRLFQWAAGENKGAAYQFPIDDPSTARESFAKWMTHPQNPRFAVSIANRLWLRHFGIAVKEPIEDLDNLDEASNPELLDYLGKVVVGVDFDLREFNRILFNTDTYQAAASASPPIGDIETYPFPGPVLRRMTAEQAWDSILLLGFGPEIDDLLIDRSHRVTRFAFDVDNASVDAIKQQVVAFKEAGYLEMNSRNGKLDLVDPTRKPNGFGRSSVLRASELEQPTRPDHFLRMFGQSSRDLADDGSREGNIPQTLMLMNGKFQELLTGKDSLLMGKLTKRDNPNRLVDNLYAAFFSRQPTQAEKARIQQAFDDGASIETLTWVLFNTPEFLFVQ